MVQVAEESGRAMAEELVAHQCERPHAPPPPATPPGVELHGKPHTSSVEHFCCEGIHALGNERT